MMHITIDDGIDSADKLPMKTIDRTSSTSTTSNIRS